MINFFLTSCLSEPCMRTRPCIAAKLKKQVKEIPYYNDVKHEVKAGLHIQYLLYEANSRCYLIYCSDSYFIPMLMQNPTGWKDCYCLADRWILLEHYHCNIKCLTLSKGVHSILILFVLYFILKLILNYYIIY